MITATPEDIIAEARRRLAKSPSVAAQALSISDEYVKEGQWLHLVVTPTREGISALDFVDAIQAIEEELRKEFGPEILIVPAKA